MITKKVIVRKNEQQAISWAGGTTTQLYISPDNATYKEFNFDYRMSHATVEIPSSTFTFMPGVTRHLMMLKGTLKINHTDRLEKVLKPFASHDFSGEWPTTAQGMVTDFNLMVRNGYRGKLSSLNFDPNEIIQLKDSSNVIGLYGFESESLQIIHDQMKIATLTAADFIYIEKNDDCEIHMINGSKPSTIIVSSIWHP